MDVDINYINESSLKKLTIMQVSARDLARVLKPATIETIEKGEMTFDELSLALRRGSATVNKDLAIIDQWQRRTGIFVVKINWKEKTVMRMPIHFEITSDH
jgi:hypothetical protein